MIVLDASVILDLLLDVDPVADEIRRHLRSDAEWSAPVLVDAEVGQALRRFTRLRAITEDRAGGALQDLSLLRLRRYPLIPLLARAFELRENATFYDALYLSLAEAAGATMLTRDRALATIPGHDARVVVL